MQVIFNNSLTQAQYDALATKVAGTLYFTTDTKRIYKGNTLYSTSAAVTNVQYNSTTKLFTITFVNGATTQIDFTAELAAKQNAKPDGTNSLVDSNNKINLTYLPDSILGQLEYCGTYNANTGAMVSDLREPSARAWRKGDYVIAATEGTKTPANTAAGRTVSVGDWVVSNGTSWDVIDNTDAVASVAGKTGAVTLVKGDVGLGNVDNTADANKNVLSATRLTTARTINGVSFDGTASIAIPVEINWE